MVVLGNEGGPNGIFKGMGAFYQVFQPLRKNRPLVEHVRSVGAPAGEAVGERIRQLVAALQRALVVHKTVYNGFGLSGFPTVGDEAPLDVLIQRDLAPSAVKEVPTH